MKSQKKTIGITLALLISSTQIISCTQNQTPNLPTPEIQKNNSINIPENNIIDQNESKKIVEDNNIKSNVVSNEVLKIEENNFNLIETSKIEENNVTSNEVLKIEESSDIQVSQNNNLLSEEAKTALTSIQENENIFLDSENIDGNFSIKSEGNIEDEILFDESIETSIIDNELDNEELFEKLRKERVSRFNVENNNKIFQNRKKINQIVIKRNNRNINKNQFENSKNFQNEMSGAGAIIIKPDGTIIINPNKAKEYVDKKEQTIKDKINDFKQKITSTIKKIATYLKDKKEIKNDTFKQKNVIVRSSSIIKTQNNDGTFTKTRSIEFYNEKTGATKTNTVSKTFSSNDLLIRIDHSLDIKIGEYTKVASRTVEITGDSKKVITESKSIWANGKIREIYEERTKNSDGTYSGSGTIKVTQPDGTVRTYNLNTSVTNEGTVSATANDIDSDTEVTVEADENDDSITIIDIDENGEEVIESVDIEEAIEDNQNNDDLIEGSDENTLDSSDETNLDSDNTELEE